MWEDCTRSAASRLQSWSVPCGVSCAQEFVLDQGTDSSGCLSLASSYDSQSTSCASLSASSQGQALVIPPPVLLTRQNSLFQVRQPVRRRAGRGLGAHPWSPCFFPMSQELPSVPWNKVGMSKRPENWQEDVRKTTEWIEASDSLSC